MAPLDRLARRLGVSGRSGLDIALDALDLSAHDRPELELAPYRAHLDEAVHATAALEPVEDAAGRGERLALALSGGLGYRGDDESYDDLANADLARVIDRRRGLPVTLGILWLAVARAQGWPATGLSFPGHFLIRLEGAAGDRVVLDPFHGGAETGSEAMRGLVKTALGPEAELLPEHYQPVADRDVLLRLCNNLRQRRVRARDYEGAIRTVTAMRVLRPDAVVFRLERAALLGRLGQIGAALDEAQGALGAAADAREQARARGLIEEFRRRLN